MNLFVPVGMAIAAVIFVSLENRGQGSGNEKQGTGNREQGTDGGELRGGFETPALRRIFLCC